MFEETTSSPQTLHIPNFWKGGDFMGIEQDDPTRVRVTKETLSRLEGLRESEVPWGYRPFDSKFGLDQGRVLDSRREPTHPLVRGKV